MKKEVISFRKTILANTTEILSERIKDPGTIEETRVRFYPGQARDLQVTPYVLHKGEKREELLTYAEGSDRFLSGDDDNLILPVVVQVDNDDYLKINVTNKSMSFPYTLVVDVVVDYHSGKNRAGVV